MSHSRHIARPIGWLAASVLLVPALAGAQSTLQPRLDELSAIRDRLRTALADKAGGDGSAPVDVLIQFDKGLHKRRPLKLVLRRHGDTWLVRSATGLPESLSLSDIDASKLVWKDGRIAGELIVRIKDTDEDVPAAGADEDSAPDEEGETDDDQTVAAMPSPTGRGVQVFRVNVKVTESEPRLVLTLHRFLGGEDWVLTYKPDGDGWAFDRELQAPRTLTRNGPFKRKYAPIAPGDRGRFETAIDLTYAGDQPRYAEAYTPLQPKITFGGTIAHGRIDSRWLLRAPGGKGLLGSGQDMLTGAIRSAELSGSYRSTGLKGRWIGDAAGAVMPVEKASITDLPDVGPAPKTTADATLTAARLYRQTRALARSLREHPLPLSDSLVRTLVPEPAWPAGATGKDHAAYVDALLTYARDLTADKRPEPAMGHIAPADTAFGPWFGLASVGSAGKANTVAAAPEGPQRWQALTGWRMVGPFGVFDRDAPVAAPEIAPVTGATFQRTRLFTNAEAEIQTLTDHAPWLQAAQDGATVYPPNDPKAHAGSMRAIVWYAAATVESPADRPVWVALNVLGRATLWVNDRRVWVSGADYHADTPAIFPVKLTKGTNRLLVRVASNSATDNHAGRITWFDGHPERRAGLAHFSSFTLHLCDRGQPSQSDSTPTATRAVRANEGTGHGGDGSGVYDVKSPPTAWDTAKGTNIAWQMDVPHGSASPVLRDGKLFVLGEPDQLLCIAADSGKQLWAKTLTHASAKASTRDVTHHASASPVVTDDAVFVHLGTGLVARLDHDGKQKWLTPLGASWNQPNMGDPLLVDGKFIVQAHLGSKRGQQFAVVAFDAETGKKLWTATGPRRRVVSENSRAEGFCPGLATMKLTRGDTVRTVIITGEGALLDAADGKLLHRNAFDLEAVNTAPVVVGDVVYTTPVTGEQAVRLWLDEQGHVGARTLWAQPSRWGRGQVKTTTTFGPKNWMQAPVIKDGRIYVVKVDSAHVPQHYPCPWTQLEVFDAETGRKLLRRRALLRDATDPTVRPVIAGDYLYVADGGAPIGGFGGTTTHGQLAVMKIMPSRDDLPWMHTATHQGPFGLVRTVARNTMPSTRCAPVFDGKRMYLRGLDKLTCVSVTDDEGLRFQRLAEAAITVREIVGRRPTTFTVTAPEPFDGDLPEGAPVSPLHAAPTGRTWLLAGPLAKGLTAERAAALTTPKTGPLTAQAAPEALAGQKLQSLDEALIEGGQLDALKALGGNRKGKAYFYTVLRAGSKTLLRYQPAAIATATWIAGKPVAKGEIIEFDVGYYPALVQVELSRVPPWLAKPKLALTFSRASRPYDSPELWQKRVDILRKHLEQIATDLRGTAEANAAKASLKAAGYEPPAQ